MFTIGSLSLDISQSLEALSDFVVLPFRCGNNLQGDAASSIPFPPEFEVPEKFETSTNCEIIARIESEGRSYFIIKSDHSAEFTEISRTALEASVATIAKHPGKVFSTTMLFSDSPKFRGVNRMYFLALLAALRDRDRCTVVADKEAQAAANVLQGVVGELNLRPSNGVKSRDVYKRPRDDLPSPTSQSSLCIFLKHQKIAEPSLSTKKNLVTLQEEDIMCVVCYDITPDVLASSCCGGLVCYFHTCLQGLYPAENVTIKKIVNNIVVTCDCGRTMSWSDLRIHKEKCSLHRNCPMPECRGRVFTEQSLKNHIRAEHCAEVIKAMIRVMKI